LQRAIQANQNLRIAYLDLGAIYIADKNYKEAETALLKAAKLDPGQPDAHYQLGRLYQLSGRKADADRELRKVRELHEKADHAVADKMPAASDVKPAKDK
jgi:Flp pilus assembly protein TadD